MNYKVDIQGEGAAFRASCEQELIYLIQHLPIHRVSQLIDYARYIQYQSQVSISGEEEESEEAVLADEALWEAEFAASQNGLQRMAEQAREQVRSGNFASIRFTQEGKMAPQ